MESPGFVGIDRDDLGVELGFPLSPHSFLLCDWSGPNCIEYARATPSKVRHLNYRSILGANDAVFSSVESEETELLVKTHAAFQVGFSPMPLPEPRFDRRH